MADNPSHPTSLLHGAYNLTDLLGELPLAEPAAESLFNQQILFDPRLRDDVRRVLHTDGRNDMGLVSRICVSLSQIDSSFINPSVPFSENLPQSSELPPILSSILALNPNVFQSSSDHPSPTRKSQASTSRETPEQLIQRPSSSANSGAHSEKVVESIKIETSFKEKDTHSAVCQRQVKAEVHAKEPLVSPNTKTVEDVPGHQIKVKKKKKKELDQLAQDNRNLAKYDARYPDTYATSQLYLGDEEDHIDVEIETFSKVYSDRKRRKDESHDDMSQAQRVTASLAVMAEEGLPPISSELADLEPADFGLSNEQNESNNHSASHVTNHKSSAAKVKKRKRDKEDNERLTVKLQLSLVGGNDDLIENVVYRNFVQLMDDIFRNVEDADLQDFMRRQKSDDDDDVPCDDDVPEEIVISRGLLSELVSESSKLCELGATSHIGAEGLGRLLTILQWNVRYGAQCLLNKNEDDEMQGAEREQALWREVAAGRVLHSIDACLTILYVLTAPNLPRQLYTDEVIEAVVGAIRFQLHHTIFPEFDPLYRTDAEGKSYGNLKSKRSRSGHVKDKIAVNIYQKIMLSVDLLANLVTMQDLGDTMLIKLTSIAVSPFFVENISELQLAALRLVVAMFAKHEQIRQFILDDVLSSLTKLPSTKRNLRSYRLWNHSGSIQMVTALVLNIVQCMAKLPSPQQQQKQQEQEQQRKNSTDEEGANENKEEGDKVVDEVSSVLQTSYDLARKTAHLFIAAFFKKCTQKSDDDYRPLFENFVQDLLTTAQRPEWPATDLMLTLLGSILMQQFTNRQLDNNIRTAALDYFGQIAARLRRDNTSATISKETVDSIVDQLKEMDSEYSDVFKKEHEVVEVVEKIVVDDADDIENESDVEVVQTKRRKTRARKGRKVQKKKSKPIKKKSFNRKKVDVDDNMRLMHLMEKAFSLFLLDASKLDPTLAYARNFCISQWYADAVTEAERSTKLHNNNIKNGIETTDTLEAIQERCDVQKEFVRRLIPGSRQSDSSSSAVNESIPVVSHDTACFLALWLGKQRSFAQSFDYFLNNILNLLNETTIAIRTRAMKSLALVVESDPSVLNIVVVRKAVHVCLSDSSTSVREAAVDLIGRFILHNADLTVSYYPLLCERINDTGVSVRKRVLKIFRDICLEQPDFSKIADLCKQMITRIGDEESIRKLVSEAFQHMWFQPLDPIREPHRLIRRVTSIVDVVSACREVGYDWFHQLLESLLKKSDESVQMTTLDTSKQIVDGLIEHTVRCEEVDAETRASASSSSTLVSTLTALSIFCKASPHLLVPHVQLLHPYLNIKCSTQGDYLVIINTCKILELAVPLMSNPNPEFVKQLESDLLAISSKQGMAVLESVIACLGAVVNRVTQHHQVVISFLEKMTTVLNHFLTNHRKNPNAEIPRPIKAGLLRNLYLIGLLCKNFDFEALQHDKSTSVRDTIMQYYLYFCVIGDDDIKHKALMGIGFFCTRYFDCLLSDQLRSHYQSLLSNAQCNPKFKVQVLNNILAGLKEQETNPGEENSACLTAPASPIASSSYERPDHYGGQHPDDLKEMFDIQSGLASNVTQMYLSYILDAYFDTNVDVRCAAAEVILLVVAHGLVHPAKCVPYLIAATTDLSSVIRTRAEQRLRDIEKRYPNFISMKALPGARKSFELQRIIQPSVAATEPIRGIFGNSKDPSDIPIDSSPAMLAALYTMLRSAKQHRRAFIVSLIKLFDESSGAHLAELVYLADNVVFFPYGTSDEVLQTIHQIEQHISISGTNLIQSVKDLCTDNAANNRYGCYSGYVAHGSVNNSNNSAEFYHIQQQQQALVDYPRVLPEDEEEFFQPQYLFEILPADLTQVHSLVTTTAQNCLLLLSAKNSLKEEYGFSDAKVRQYVSSSGNRAAQKLYEKPPPRRQSVRYAPCQLETLRNGPPPVPMPGDIHGRQNLVGQLVEFKQLLDSLDNDAVSAAAGLNESGGDFDDTFDMEDGDGGEFGEGDMMGEGHSNNNNNNRKAKSNKTPKRNRRGGGRGGGGRSNNKAGGGRNAKSRKSFKNRGGGDDDSDFDDDLDDWGDPDFDDDCHS